jgi:hypothetical protein
VIEPGDWWVKNIQQMTKAKVPVDFEIKWKAIPLFSDTFARAEDRPTPREYPVTLCRDSERKAHARGRRSRRRTRAVAGLHVRPSRRHPERFKPVNSFTAGESERPRQRLANFRLESFAGRFLKSPLDKPRPDGIRGPAPTRPAHPNSDLRATSGRDPRAPSSPEARPSARAGRLPHRIARISQSPGSATGQLQGSPREGLRRRPEHIRRERPKIGIGSLQHGSDARHSAASSRLRPSGKAPERGTVLRLGAGRR